MRTCRSAGQTSVWTIMMGRAGWLRGLLLVACLAGGDAYVVPTSQHVLQLAARRAAPPPPRAPSTTASPESEWYISHTWCVPSPVTPPSPRELRLRLLFDTETGTDPHQGRHPLRERNPDITREGRLPFRVQSLFELTNSKPTKLALHSHRRWRWTLRLPARGARSSGGIPKSSVRAEKRRIG